MPVPFDDDSTVLSFCNDHLFNNFLGSLESVNEIPQETVAVDTNLTCDTNCNNTQPAMSIQMPEHVNTDEFFYDLKGMQICDKFTTRLLSS
jgi:hypothetical protein